jgi:hypothetical protein
MKFNRLGAFTLGVVITAVSVGAVSFVNAAGDKQLKACANKKTGVMRYISKGSCNKKTETSLSWNQMGLQGLTGSAGTNGAAGAKGDTGAAGTKGDTGAMLAITQQFVCDGADANIIKDEACAIGMTGPGGGHVFFVDYYNQYTNLDYLEAAPKRCEEANRRWSSDTRNSLEAVSGWAGRAVGRGQANTTAMMTSSDSYVADTSGAAEFADSSTCGGKSDWFLGSLGEMKLMYDNLQGVGDFDFNRFYWSSSEYFQGGAWYQSFQAGFQGDADKSAFYYVRPVRAF